MSAIIERSEVSIHEARVYRLLATHPARWWSTQEIATDAGVKLRTARAHALKLSKLGVIEVAEVFPGHRYRLVEQRSAPYVQRLERVCEVFGLGAGQ